ncbi:beta-ketoacyl-ACP synthase 3 [Actinacidiphila sp. ITFR-21]|uniref:beta-ketoacyl-ACP synthase 3 n=1 Tax=Actinacidiphila sp. ITFR-21 TaxID=3075199 RepID=UPI00288A7145|nr:beta-ketoacyl-ACP synthase 3 [Streptomyces sp. ITFR-21]WNI18002.1 beta-ketoacyl-ACP synthase 3 [Streptomyces sp. ITFR-21]
MHSTETERTFPPAAENRHAALLGIGTYRPRRIVTNEEICRTLDSDPDWIVRRSGISTRPFAQSDETLVEMGATAAGKALAEAGMAPTDVDQILVATMSDLEGGDELAAEIGRRLGVAARGVKVSAACAGFTVGLSLAASTVTSGAARNCLLVAVERMSDILDPLDRGTAFLFSDGAGAAVVGQAAEPGIGPVVWGTEPELADAITVRPEPEHDGRPYLRMQGASVFRWAVTNLPGVVETALSRSGLAPGDLQAFVPHQANLRIIESVADSVGFPEHVAIARDIVDQGNASAASIPLALDRMRTSGTLRSGDLALLIGFGAGLSYAATVIRMP